MKLTGNADENHHRPWMTGEESRQRVIDKTIEILRTHPFSAVTSRTIASAADVSNSSITRNFGSMEGLFVAVIERIDSWFAESPPGSLGSDLIHPDVALRSRLVAWMLGEGMNPPKISLERTLAFTGNRQIDRQEISERTASSFAQVALFLGQGLATFAPVHPEIDDLGATDAVRLIDWLESHLDVAERDLGWARNSPTQD